MLRIMHRVYGPALPAAILLIGIGAMGKGGASARRAAPRLVKLARAGAMRLCSDFISDVTSPEGRAAMAHGHATYHRTYRHYRHCTHGRHCG